MGCWVVVGDQCKPPTQTPGAKPGEAESNNRSVMPLDVLGCTRATLTGGESGAGPRGVANQETLSCWG